MHISCKGKIYKAKNLQFCYLLNQFQTVEPDYDFAKVLVTLLIIINQVIFVLYKI